MSDLSEQGLERLEAWAGFAERDPDMERILAMETDEVLALVSALRQARADLQEARELLESLSEPSKAPIHWRPITIHDGTQHSDTSEVRSSCRICAFLARTAPREGGE